MNRTIPFSGIDSHLHTDKLRKTIFYQVGEYPKTSWKMSIFAILTQASGILLEKDMKLYGTLTTFWLW